MTKFIEVTLRHSGRKISISIDRIIAVKEVRWYAELLVNEIDGFLLVDDSYRKVMSKINDASSK